MHRDEKDNHHSGQWYAYHAEEAGARVERPTDGRHGYKISTDEGSVYVPDRELYPCESRVARKMLRLIGIVICIGIMIGALLYIGG